MTTLSNLSRVVAAAAVTTAKVALLSLSLIAVGHADELTMVSKNESPKGYRACKSRAQVINGELDYIGRVLLDDPDPDGKLIGYLIAFPDVFADGTKVFADGTKRLSVQCINGQMIIRVYK